MRLFAYVLFPVLFVGLLASNKNSWWSKLYHRAAFDVAQSCDELTGETQWNRIGKLRLYLGSIPLENKTYIEHFRGLGINRILTAVAPDLTNLLVSRAVWHQRGILTLEILASESQPLTLEQLQAGVTFLHEELERGNTIYIQCEADTGRTMAILTGYLMRYAGMTPNEAINYIKKFRPGARISPAQAAALVGLRDALKIRSIPL